MINLIVELEKFVESRDIEVKLNLADIKRFSQVLRENGYITKIDYVEQPNKNNDNIILTIYRGEEYAATCIYKVYPMCILEIFETTYEWFVNFMKAVIIIY